MKNILAFLLGFLASPIVFALRLAQGEYPRWPTDAEFQPDNPGDWWHYSKNASATVIQRNPHLFAAALVLAIVLCFAV